MQTSFALTVPPGDFTSSATSISTLPRSSPALAMSDHESDSPAAAAPTQEHPMRLDEPGPAAAAASHGAGAAAAGTSAPAKSARNNKAATASSASSRTDSRASAHMASAAVQHSSSAAAGAGTGVAAAGALAPRPSRIADWPKLQEDKRVQRLLASDSPLALLTLHSYADGSYRELVQTLPRRYVKQLCTAMNIMPEGNTNLETRMRHALRQAVEACAHESPDLISNEGEEEHESDSEEESEAEPQPQTRPERRAPERKQPPRAAANKAAPAAAPQPSQHSSSSRVSQRSALKQSSHRRDSASPLGRNEFADGSVLAVLGALPSPPAKSKQKEPRNIGFESPLRAKRQGTHRRVPAEDDDSDSDGAGPPRSAVRAARADPPAALSDEEAALTDEDSDDELGPSASEDDLLHPSSLSRSLYSSRAREHAVASASEAAGLAKSMAKPYLRNVLAHGKSVYVVFKHDVEFQKARNQRECLSLARILDALLAKRYSDAREIAVRRLAGVHAADQSGDGWDICDAFEQVTERQCFVPDDFMTRALKNVIRVQALNKSSQPKFGAGFNQAAAAAATTSKKPFAAGAFKRALSRFPGGINQQGANTGGAGAASSSKKKHAQQRNARGAGPKQL